MKLNLTSVALIAIIIGLSLFGTRQCSERRSYKKQFEGAAASYERCLENSTLSEYALVDYHTKKESKIRDSLNYYKNKSESYLTKVYKLNTRIRSYEAHIRTLSDSIGKLSPETSLGYLDANFVPGGNDVIITENQVKDIHIMDLTRLDQKEIIISQEESIDLLDKSLGECMSGLSLSVKELTSCQTDNLKKDLKIKSQKRKVRNRTLFGGIMTGLLVVAVL